jgi:hypothetical protein
MICCRPYTEFWRAKQAAAQALAEVVDELRWDINSSSIPAIAYSRTLYPCPPGSIAVAACQWLLAAPEARSWPQLNYMLNLALEHAGGQVEEAEGFTLLLAFSK